MAYTGDVDLAGIVHMIISDCLRRIDAIFEAGTKGNGRFLKNAGFKLLDH